MELRLFPYKNGEHLKGKSVRVSNHQPLLRVFWGSEIAKVKYQYVVETYNYYMKMHMFQMVPTNSEHYHHPFFGYFKPRLYRSFFTPCNSVHRCHPYTLYHVGIGYIPFQRPPWRVFPMILLDTPQKKLHPISIPPRQFQEVQPRLVFEGTEVVHY